jgi:hypothetical protein
MKVKNNRVNNGFFIQGKIIFTIIELILCFY